MCKKDKFVNKKGSKEEPLPCLIFQEQKAAMILR
jgi:hypothetical protein